MYSKGFEMIQPYLEHAPTHYNPYECVVAMFALIYLSKFVQVVISFTCVGKYDNINANFRNGGFEGKSWGHKAAQRAYNAHLNHWEAFIGFAVAMILALSKVSPDRHQELALLGNAFLLQRVVYNAVYVIASNEALSFIRSSIFGVGMLLIVRIFVIAVTA